MQQVCCLCDVVVCVCSRCTLHYIIVLCKVSVLCCVSVKVDSTKISTFKFCVVVSQTHLIPRSHGNGSWTHSAVSAYGAEQASGTDDQ